MRSKNTELLGLFYKLNHNSPTVVPQRLAMLGSGA